MRIREPFFTEGIKYLIIGSAIVIVFIVTIALVASGPESQGDALERAGNSCPNGLKQVIFQEGTNDISSIKCKE